MECFIISDSFLLQCWWWKFEYFLLYAGAVDSRNTHRSSDRATRTEITAIFTERTDEMISYIRGELAAVGEEQVVVEVQGIGYGIFMPGQAMTMLPPIGSEVKIHTYLNVREDAMQLFGFLTKDDLKVFSAFDRSEWNWAERRLEYFIEDDTG